MHKHKTKSLVLGSGGARGFAHIGEDLIPLSQIMTRLGTGNSRLPATHNSPDCKIYHCYQINYYGIVDNQSVNYIFIAVDFSSCVPIS